MSGADHGAETVPPRMLSLADRLRQMGYDIEPPPLDEAPGSSIVARRAVGDRAELLAIDAGGRFRATITWVVGEWSSRDSVAGVPVRAVDTVTRSVTVTGQVEEPERFLEVVAGLGKVTAWASVAEPERPFPGSRAEHNRSSS
ncbi:MAG: hypothetical protein H0T18_05090 [Chloroflexia bacterium]|nr:hypothetical protein [Chloroflexia bacterium]